MAHGSAAAMWPGILAVLEGSAWMWVGLRGRRVGDHPYCRRCGYDLFGRPAESTRCSECGAELGAPGAIRVGGRRRRRWAIVLGLMLALAGGGWVELVTSGVTVNQLKPAWWLARDLRGRDGKAAAEAFKELERRHSSGKVSAEHVDAMADFCLARHARWDVEWNERWADFIENLQCDGTLGAKRWARYLVQCYPFTLEVRERVRRGDPIPLRFQFRFPEGCGSNGPPQDIRYGGRVSARVGGADYVAAAGAVELPPINVRGRSCFPTMLSCPEVLQPDAGTWAKIADGRQVVVLESDVDVREVKDGPVVARVPVRWEATFEVLPADRPSARLVDDPALEEKVRQAISVKIERQPDAPTERDRFHSRIDMRNAPMRVWCEVMLKSGDRQWSVGMLSTDRTGSTSGGFFPGTMPGLPDVVDVVLTPVKMEELLRDVDGIGDFWGRPIEIRGVKVEREPQR